MGRGIETAEKLGLLKDIIGVISDNNTNINSANVMDEIQISSNLCFVKFFKTFFDLLN